MTTPAWQFEDISTEEGTEEDMVAATEQLEEDGVSKRGRGRPQGSTNKSNGADELKAEITQLHELLQQQNIKIMNLENKAPSVNFEGPALPPNLEKRLDVIQRWVETLHLFLNTGRITNSVDGAAEEELELIIQNLPEIPVNA